MEGFNKSKDFFYSLFIYYVKHLLISKLLQKESTPKLKLVLNLKIRVLLNYLKSMVVQVLVCHQVTLSKQLPNPNNHNNNSSNKNNLRANLAQVVKMLLNSNNKMKKRLRDKKRRERRESLKKNLKRDRKLNKLRREIIHIFICG